MAKIQEFNIARLRTEEDFGFQKRIEADQPMVTAYKAALGIEKQKQIHIDAWVIELQKGYDAFMEASAARDAEASQRITGIVKQTRTEADIAYRALVERVNALALINGEAPYATFIDRINVLIN